MKWIRHREAVVKRTMLTLAVAALLLVSGSTFAGPGQMLDAVAQGNHGGPKEVNLAHSFEGFGPTYMPRTQTEEVVIGPMSSGLDTLGVKGSALVTPRGGGSMLSSQQLAGKSIQKTIRRLG